MRQRRGGTRQFLKNTPSVSSLVRYPRIDRSTTVFLHLLRKTRAASGWQSLHPCLSWQKYSAADDQKVTALQTEKNCSFAIRRLPRGRVFACSALPGSLWRKEKEEEKEEENGDMCREFVGGHGRAVDRSGSDAGVRGSPAAGGHKALVSMCTHLIIAPFSHSR